MKKVNIIGGRRSKKGVNTAFKGVTNVFNKLTKFGIVKKLNKRNK